MEGKIPWQSPYSTFDNNPIEKEDMNGAVGNSTHTDKNGNVLAVKNDGDLGVYMHKNAKTALDIDKTYSAENTSGGGLKMGTTLMWNSFTTRRDENKPAWKIAFGSYAARDWINKSEGK